MWCVLELQSKMVTKYHSSTLQSMLAVLIPLFSTLVQVYVNVTNLLFLQNWHSDDDFYSHNSNDISPDNSCCVRLELEEVHIYCRKC